MGNIIDITDRVMKNREEKEVKRHQRGKVIDITKRIKEKEEERLYLDVEVATNYFNEATGEEVDKAIEIYNKAVQKYINYILMEGDQE